MQASNSSSRPFEGRVAIVTGAGKGLGAAFARELARQGARIVVNNRLKPGRADEAAAVAAEIRAAGGEAVAEHSDITDPDAGKRLAAAALDTFGQLDVVVCNAGITGPAAKFSPEGPATIRTVIDTNLFATADILAACQPALEASDAARVLMVSSSAGLYGVRGRTAYAASKGAMNAFALTLADEWRKAGILVNVLCPYAATQMTADVNRPDEIDQRLLPENIAPAAAWLTSPALTRTGEIWLGGAGWLRRVRIVETEGGPMPDTPDGFEAFAQTQSGLETARGFPGAEPAFADLYKTMARHQTEADS